MPRRRLGASSLVVSRIGLGCMSLGTDPAQATEIVAAALEAGVTHLDTADLYDAGRNEEIVGAALRALGARDAVTVATKAGNERRADGAGWSWNPDPDYLERALEASLRRLGRDHVDLFQLHGGTLDDPIDDIIERFERLQDRGLIGAYGISSIRPNVIRAWLERAPRLASVQLQLSLLDRRPEEAVLDALAAGDVAAIVRGPVARGLMAGKPPTSYLGHDGDAVGAAAAAVARVAAAGPGRTPAQVAIGWALDHPAVAMAIPGASSPRQARDNAGAAALDLAPEERATLDRAVPALRYEKHR